MFTRVDASKVNCLLDVAQRMHPCFKARIDVQKISVAGWNDLHDVKHEEERRMWRIKWKLRELYLASVGQRKIAIGNNIMHARTWVLF